MRFYLTTIQYNAEKEAENRSVPKAFDSEEKAIAEFHKQMENDMNNDTLGWAMSIIIDEYGNTLRRERWTRPIDIAPISVNPTPIEPEVTE